MRKKSETLLLTLEIELGTENESMRVGVVATTSSRAEAGIRPETWRRFVVDVALRQPFRPCIELTSPQPGPNLTTLTCREMALPQTPLVLARRIPKDVFDSEQAQQRMPELLTGHSTSLSSNEFT